MCLKNDCLCTKIHCHRLQLISVFKRENTLQKNQQSVTNKYIAPFSS